MASGSRGRVCAASFRPGPALAAGRPGGREAGRPAASGQRGPLGAAKPGCTVGPATALALCRPRCPLRGARGGMAGSAHGRGRKGQAAALRWLSTRPFQLGSEQSLQRGRRAESCREA